ncbi:MAG: carbon-nitrogen hydrolase family protein [Candidatus Bathyarchaeota archaeon]|nr:carbon-nitrogen hydrolase family protein [Candidatus Bathyarchaeota archaeon]
MPSRGPVLAVAQSASARGDVEGNVARHTRFAEAAAEHGARLIVFPELSLTGYEPDIAAANVLTPDDPRLRPFRDIAEKHSITIVAGAPYRSLEGLHIAAFALQPRGAHIYTKHHLHHGEEAYFSAGTMGLEIGLDGERVSFAICADTTHPSHAEAAARAGATVYAAGVFITPTGIEADSAQLRGYAKDHRMVVLMANFAAPSSGFATAGRSAIWDELGETVVQAPGVGDALLIAHREDGAMKGELVNP